jgi:hypothetical protein
MYAAQGMVSLRIALPSGAKWIFPRREDDATSFPVV